MKKITYYTFIFILTLFIYSCDGGEPIPIDPPKKTDTANTKVDFGSELNIDGEVAKYFFGGTISTYGTTAIGKSAGTKQLLKLKRLKLDAYRIPLKWNNGNIISSAVGGPRDISGEKWISKLNEIGGEPVIVIGGKSTNNDIDAKDAANMVKYFKDKGMPVKEWIIGNEPGLDGMSIQEYCKMFNKVSDAMKAVDSSIKIGGPAWSNYNLNALRTFIKLSGTRADAIDYHHYGMGDSFLSEEKALLETKNYDKEIKEIRSMIKTELSGAENRIEIQLGEYHWSYRPNNGYQGWNGDDRYYKAVTTLWVASVAGLVAKNGARSFQYSDLNGALGLTFEKKSDATHFGQNINDPNPAYWGLFMFTGGNLFRHFGNEFVDASTSIKNVEIYASKAKNIILINKNPNLSKIVRFKIEGLASNEQAEIWQTSRLNPFRAPTNKGIHAIKDGILTYTIPPYSITTLVVK